MVVLDRDKRHGIHRSSSSRSGPVEHDGGGGGDLGGDEVE